MSDDDSLLLDDSVTDEICRQAAQNYLDGEQALKKLPKRLRECLLPFQRDGILFGFQHNGSCLLSDEMGLGKTLQAIGLSVCYEDEWPMLVVVPSSLKYVWLEELQRWLPQLTPDLIHLVSCAEDIPNLSKCKVAVVSYGLFQYKRFYTLLKSQKITFRVIVCDEAHYLKNWKSQRTKNLLELLKSANRRILISGTPALARPEELYTLISAVRPGTFGTYTEYCQRYCNGHYNYRIKRFDVSGSSNLEELHARLTKDVMIRRLKDQVLTQLPPKQRQKISFDFPVKSLREIEKVKLELNELKSLDSGKNEFRINKNIMELYKLTGVAKIPACVEYVKEVLKQNVKFLVFAHHIAMLDAVERELIAARTGYMRIDGSVGAAQRQQHVSTFQNSDDCKVALLGIQAAGVGLTLTAASVVVFCELHWSPGVLQQAEDRVHR